MINLYGIHFEYNHISSRKYNLIIANLSTERMTKIAGDKSGHFVLNKAMKSRYLVDDDYSDSNLTFEIEIVTCDDRAIEMHELREIETWLFTNSAFHKLFVDIADDKYGETYEMLDGIQKRLYFNCRFVNAEKIEGNGGVIGFKCTMETDGMMLWQEPISVQFAFEDPVEVEVSGEIKTYRRGDVNFDGKVTAEDSQIVLQEATHRLSGFPPTFTEVQDAVANIKEDYTETGQAIITAEDAQLILMAYITDLANLPVDTGTVVIDGREYILSGDERLASVYVDSDIDGYTYPKVRMFFGTPPQGFNTCDIEIINGTDNNDRKTVLSNIAPNSIITIDGETRSVLLGDVASGTSAYDKMTSKHFPRLVNGENQIIIKSASLREINFEWQNRRYL